MLEKAEQLEAMLSPDGRDARGNIRETEDEIARLFTGITEQPVEANKIIKYTSYEYKKAIRAASAPYNRAQSTRINLSQKIYWRHIACQMKESFWHRIKCT